MDNLNNHKSICAHVFMFLISSFQMAAAVDHMHSRNIVHRDIKVTNYISVHCDMFCKHCNLKTIFCAAQRGRNLGQWG